MLPKTEYQRTKAVAIPEITAGVAKGHSFGDINCQDGNNQRQRQALNWLHRNQQHEQKPKAVFHCGL